MFLYPALPVDEALRVAGVRPRVVRAGLAGVGVNLHREEDARPRLASHLHGVHIYPSGPGPLRGQRE